MNASGRHFYHADGERFLKILDAGTITPDSVDVDGCLPIVWCSPSTREIGISEHALEILEGFFRIEIPPACVPVTWPEFRRTFRIDLEVTSALRIYETPVKWRGSFFEIPKGSWLGIEEWTGSEWERVSNPREAIEFWNPGKEGAIDADELEALLRIGT